MSYGISRALARLSWLPISVRSLLACAALLGANLSAHADVQFSCEGTQLSAAQRGMDAYLSGLGIAPAVFSKTASGTSVTYRLDLPMSKAGDTSTLYFKFNPALAIEDETITLPGAKGKLRSVRTVSKKEIVLALLQNGRMTEFKGTACNVDALADQVGVRQNMVAWAETLEWGWPDGGSAAWNKKYWLKGTPTGIAPLHEAMTDVFVNQPKYSVGCYTATKFVMVQGVLDYYRRVKGDAKTAALVEARLLADGEPLVDIEPGRMWYFEDDIEPSELTRPGKLLGLQDSVAAENFVPGDWSYVINNDPVSHAKTGYEGSNAVYLGGNRFNDYYNDNNHGYHYHEKLHEVYQWRNGVFSRSRDFAKITDLTSDDYNRYGRAPSEGGFVLSIRATPLLFGYEALPALPVVPPTPASAGQ